jgi:hypothetical protein
MSVRGKPLEDGRNDYNSVFLSPAGIRIVYISRSDECNPAFSEVSCSFEPNSFFLRSGRHLQLLYRVNVAN